MIQGQVREEEEVHRGTDHLRATGVGGLEPGGGFVPSARDQRANLLSPEGEAQLDERVGRLEAEDAGGREPAAEKALGGIDAGCLCREGHAG